MRYFYYGMGNMEDTRGSRAGDNYRRNRRQRSSRSSLVIDEDTIYEIDEECEECRRRQNRME